MRRACSHCRRRMIRMHMNTQVNIDGSSLRGRETVSRFTAVFSKGDQILTSCLLYCALVPFRKSSTLKENNLLLLEFLEGAIFKKDRVTYLKRCVNSPHFPLCFRKLNVRLVIRRLRVRPSPRRKHSVVECDHEVLSTVIPPSADSKKAVVSFWQKNVHYTG